MIENVTTEQAEAIAREVMQAEIAPLLFELEVAREELRQLNDGDRVVMPKDREHAECMFKLAAMYLGYWNPLDGGEFKFPAEGL